MDINKALNILEQNNGTSTVDIFVPSLKRNVSFKPITIGKVKSISQMFLNNGFDSDLHVILTSIMLDLCVEDLKLKDLCEIDRVRILMELYTYNNFSDNEYEIDCSNEGCTHQVSMKVDLTTLYDKFDEVEEEIVKDFNISGIDYKITFHYPSLDLVLKYKKFIEDTKTVLLNDVDSNFSEEDTYKIEFYMMKYSNLLFIKDIQLNGENIDGFRNLSIADRNAIIDNLPPKILQYVENDIIQNDHFKMPRFLDVVTTCPKCNKGKMKLDLTIEDFFLI